MRSPDIQQDLTITIVANQHDLDIAFEIRRRVFVLEQGFELADEYDADDARAIHLLVHKAEQSIATARIIPDGEIARIGRVAVLPEYRGAGYGLAITAACEEVAVERGSKIAQLHSQIQVQSFYERAGYKTRGDIFDECGWPHITMEKVLSSR
ncbi:MAG: GNAT family N-acetyltransferase [Candidatus Marinimicrobia bacterium]|nr:GNAT family N-acetyltransferase [Candidatus Neomarinimicrobiota bacterium]MCF7839891.1 GNAT family N-acetyltransferase [Candidatus Neomarinimicrobiota bacterium]MCF7902461.1 GNAT family N-acetyltransferase [Candidatus Neomarinimicrobiota bacterium]